MVEGPDQLNIKEKAGRPRQHFGSDNKAAPAGGSK